MDQTSLLTLLKDFHQLTYSLTQVLQHGFVVHEGLIGAVKLDPEVLETHVRAHLTNILRALPLGLGRDDHGDALLLKCAT